MIMVTTTKKAMRIPGINRIRFTYFITINLQHMKNLIIFCLMAFLSPVLMAQESPIQPAAPVVKKKTAVVSEKLETAEFMVLGNCGMCEKVIEKAALGAGASVAEWDVKADMLKVSFPAKKTSTDAIQKAVAQAGYDNAGYKADDEAYNKLHGCCKYDRTGAAGGTKSCTDTEQH